MQRIFFEVALGDTIRGLYQFTRYLDQQRALGNMAGECLPCVYIPSDLQDRPWNKEDSVPSLVYGPRISFVMLKCDFDSLGIKQRFCNDQDCFLVIGQEVGQGAHYLYADGTTKYAGKVHVSETGFRVSCIDQTYIMSEGQFVAADIYER